ncbi:glycoside hydrolase 3 [Hypoxylon texense]
MAVSNRQVQKGEMVKPSGPLNVELAFVRHYPTFKTRKIDYGHVLGMGNPCFKFQHGKIGPNPSARTLDMILVRIPFTGAFAKSWPSKFNNDVAILNRCEAFQREGVLVLTMICKMREMYAWRILVAKVNCKL